MIGLFQSDVINATGQAASNWGWPAVILIFAALAIVFIYKRHLAPYLDKRAEYADKKDAEAARVLKDTLEYTRQEAKEDREHAKLQIERAEALRNGVLKDLSEHMRTQTDLNRKILEELEDAREERRRGR